MVDAFQPTVRFRDDPVEYKRQYNRHYHAGGRSPRKPRKRALLRLIEMLDREHGEVMRPGLTRCWEWQGARNADGYGMMRGDKDPDTGQQPLILVHRLALAAALGRPIRDGMLACHRCYNRRCARPSHLYEGTVSDNNNDVWELRRARGHEANAL